MANNCTHCMSEYHTAFLCPRKPNKPIKRKSYIRKRGKRALVNKETNSIWLENNPPNKYGYWECYLRISPHCLKRVTIENLNIEHMYSKARRPDLRDKQENLNPSCQACNELKGSKNVTDFANDFPHLRKYII